MRKAKSSLSREPSVLPYLPEGIIIDILTRLPVKTLVRFKCVSKSWLNLISNTNFIDNHLVKSSTTFSFAHQNIILWHKIPVDGPQRDSYYLKSCSLHSLFSPPFDNNNLINDHSLQLDYMSTEIVGSCNGLVCILMEGEAFVLWNPSTREYKKLSILENNLGFTFGFGYDELNKDYKVVQMEYYSSSCKKKVKIYSFLTNSWKKIGDFPSTYGALSCNCKFVNGALHWRAWDSNGTYATSVIVSLHLGNETYGEIAEPDYGGGNCSSSLIVLEGCISLCYNYKAIKADIWVMKEYGLRDSWVKLYTIPYIPEKHVYSHYVLFSDSVTGETLVKHDEMLMIYYPKYGTFTSKSIKNMLRDPEGATTYLESLVSP